MTTYARQSIDLTGKWLFRLSDIPDSLKSGAVTQGALHLPGTLDTNKAGIPVAQSQSTDNLSRRFTYMGPTVYTRYVTIPESARGKKILLNLERTRPTSVKVDGIDAGSRAAISATQSFDLTPFLTPGKHLLEITVDNGDAIPPAVRNSSHACTEATQTNWNGIIGDISLQIIDPTNISGLKVTSDVAGKAFILDGALARDKVYGPLTVTAECNGQKKSKTIPSDSPDEFSIYLPLGDDAQLWSEWNPTLYDITVTLTDNSGRVLDTVTRRSGLREFSTSGRHFTINGNPTFLRGRHDACVWPLSAHVPMDLESWRKYFKILKDYGINHVRFHSWCPPEACFTAADEAGIYLQPELTIWGEIDKDQTPLLEFLQEDMEAIIDQYGHHPSFTMFAIGNELWGDTSIMKDYIDNARELQPGLLATYGSNIYLGHQGHIEGEDFLVTCRVGDGDGFSTHARASFSFADADNGGIMNSTYPNTTMNFSDAIDLSPVPVVGHETGQYQIYPDFSTIKKYKGVLRPDNLTEFKRRAQDAGTLRKAEKYAKASGEWATRLYKADMEMNLRTPEMGGFQLLDLQDYPGQGTALVGILDPFMDSKGLITPEKWRESCNDLTILAE
ncbi:MAG: beta-glycosidase, partial [Muribaculaceae bacterium]|nr:beta-glycosidase [Muribaculaceae bacterium]